MPLFPRHHWPLAGLALVLAVAWFAYLPGLGGGFLFDDFVNLNALGATGPVDDARTFWRYVTSGTADPTGRPLALLSFLIDARNWPAEPAPFLRTNVLLHLLNGVLLYALLARLGRGLDADPVRPRAVALLASGMWLLHPLLVSTTLYIVQREAMLPATFTLLALWAYAAGRQRFSASDGRSGLATMVLAIGLGTVAATLSKANGALLPLLAWVLDATILSQGDAALSPEARRRLRIARGVLLMLPTLVVVAYLARFLPRLGADLPNRPWTIAQRLLSEPRALLDYIYLLVVPRSGSAGLFNDSFAVAQGLWRPLSTVPALLAIMGLVATAFAVRRRTPRLSAALGFFFAAHLLESTLVPLELYFEHRNYLPALLFFWPLAHAVAAWRVAPSRRIAVGVALLALLAFTTWQRASMWGDPERLQATWARQNPGSPRAQASAGIALLRGTSPEAAARALDQEWQRQPDELQLAFNAVNAHCAWRGLEPAQVEAVAGALRNADHAHLLAHQWLARAIQKAASRSCRGLTLEAVDAWITAAERNPTFARRRGQNLEPLRALLAMRNGQADAALRHFNRALAAKVSPDVAARNASALAAAGHYTQALAHLDHYESIKHRRSRPRAGMAWLHRKVLEWQGYWPHEMTVLRGKIQAEIDAQGKAP